VLLNKDADEESKDAASAKQKHKNNHMLSGSEFDELDAQLEHILEEGVQMDDDDSEPIQN